MAGSTTTRADRRKARTVRSILAAAETEFVEHGYHPARVEAISERADVAVGSIYAHFRSKLGLYLAVLDRALALQEAELRSAMEAAATPADKLRAVGDAYLRFYLEHPGYFRLLAQPPAARVPADLADTAEALTARGERLSEEMAAVVADGVADGSLRRVDPGRTARFLWGAWNGVISLHLRRDRLRLDDDELVAVLEEGDRIVTHGLAAD